MRDSRFFQLIALLCFLLAPSLSVSQDSSGIKTVTVWGESPIYEGNIVQARERALQNGFTQAVMKVMGTYISTQSFLENYLSIEKSILRQDYAKSINSKTRGYIKTYTILETNQQPDTLMLKLKVQVSQEPIKDDLTALGILLDAMGNPIIKVTGNDEGLDEPRSVSVFNPILAAKGFHLLESDSGKQPDVAILLKGAVTSVNNIDNSGLYCAVVGLQAEVLEQGIQKVISSKHRISNGCGLDEKAALSQAYERAADLLAPEIMESVTEIWGRQLTSGRTLELLVKIQDYGRLDRFSNYLGQIFGVKQVDLKSFQDKEAKFLIRFAGQTKTFADLILRMPFGGFEIFVQRLNAASLVLLVD